MVNDVMGGPCVKESKPKERGGTESRRDQSHLFLSNEAPQEVLRTVSSNDLITPTKPHFLNVSISFTPLHWGPSFQLNPYAHHSKNYQMYRRRFWMGTPICIISAFFFWWTCKPYLQVEKIFKVYIVKTRNHCYIVILIWNISYRVLWKYL